MKQKMISLLVMFSSVTYSQNTFLNSGTNVGIATTSPATLLEVKSSVDYGVSGTQFVAPLIVGWSNDYGAGAPAQWLLLTPYISSGTGLQSAGLNGTLTFYRGSTGSSNVNIDYHLNIQSAYSITVPNMVPLSMNSPVVAFYKVVYNGNSYLAINPATVHGSSTMISYCGYFWNNFASPQNIKPQLVLASSTTGATIIQGFQSISSNAMYVNTQNFIGIGTTNPVHKLDVDGTIHGSSFLAGTQLMIDNNQIAMYNADAQLYAMNGLKCSYWDGAAVQTAFKISNTGSIGIGTLTPSPNCKLDVNGNIFTNSKIVIGTTDMVKVGTYSLAVNGDAIFKRAVVKPIANWPDYVFDHKYRLLPLPELEKFLSTNKHLPGVPLAADIEKEGIDIGITQTILLEKIEELTLYIIEQDKKITNQNKKIATQDKKEAVQDGLINKLVMEMEALKRQFKKNS